MEGGLFETAREAAQKTEIADIIQKIQGDIITEQANSNGEISEVKLDEILNRYGTLSGEGENKILTTTEKEYKIKVSDIFNGTISGEIGKTEDLQLLEKYFVGKNLLNLVDLESGNFKEDSNSITDASISLKLLTGTEMKIGTDVAFYIRYHNKAYKIIYKIISVDEVTQEINSIIKSVNFEYEPTGMEGQTIEYSYDGTEANKKEWKVIYDDGTNIEIASPDAMGNFTIGYQDSEAVGANNEEKTIDSYNNLVVRMNNYCTSLITNENKISVRSVGSNPENPNNDNSAYQTSNNLGSYSGLIKSRDENYMKDEMKLAFYNIENIEKEYFLASRYSYYQDFENGIEEDSFYTRNISNRSSEFGSLFIVRNGTFNPSNHSNAVRPIVKINKNNI